MSDDFFSRSLAGALDPNGYGHSAKRIIIEEADRSIVRDAIRVGRDPPRVYLEVDVKYGYLTEHNARALIDALLDALSSSRAVNPEPKGAVDDL